VLAFFFINTTHVTKISAFECSWPSVTTQKVAEYDISLS